MDNKYKFLFKNTALLTIGNFSSKILVFLMVPLYTNVLTTEEYGVYDLIISSIQLVMPILTLNIVDAVMRFGMDHDIPKKKTVTVGVKYITISIIAIAIMLFLNMRFGLWKDLADYTFYVLIYYISWIANQMAVQFAKALERVKEIAIAGVLSTAVTIICNLLFLLVLKFQLEGFFLAYIFGQAIPALYLFLSVRIHEYCEIKMDKEVEKDMLRYSVPLILNNLTWNINSVSDRYVVTWLCGVAVNGIYSVSYKIPTIISTVQSIFTQAWQISAIKEYGTENRDDFYRNMFSYLNIVMCVGGAALILLTKPLAYVLYAKEFYVAWQYVPFLVISCVLNSASGYIGQILAAKKDTKSLAISSFYGAGVNLVLNVVLVLWIGAQGAAVATAVSSFVIFLRRKKTLDEVFELKNYGVVLLSWMFLVIQGTLLICVDNIFLQVLLVCVMIFLYKKEIGDILNKVLKLNRNRECK